MSKKISVNTMIDKDVLNGVEEVRVAMGFKTYIETYNYMLRLAIKDVANMLAEGDEYGDYDTLEDGTEIME